MSRHVVPFARPLIEAEEKEAVLQALDSGWLSTGPFARQFEGDFARFVGSRHAVAVNSCTAALHLALAALGVGEGDEVLTTPLTFAATAEVIHYFRARPVFVDIDPATLNLDPAAVAAGRGRDWQPGRAKAIVPVHFAGMACDMDALLPLARREGLRVVEDAAHAFPTRYRGRMVGTLSDATCFSFYATKTITTGEGGMITTDDDEVADLARVLSLHGISRSAWNRYSTEGSWYYEVLHAGYKYNMPDLAAALGVAQLAKAERLMRLREAIARRYDAAFGEHPALELPPRPAGDGTTHSWHLYVLRLHLERLRIDRARFIEELKEAGVHASVHFIPLHMQPFHREAGDYAPDSFPHAHAYYRRALSLPIWPGMSDADVNHVADTVLAVAGRHAR